MRSWALESDKPGFGILIAPVTSHGVLSKLFDFSESIPLSIKMDFLKSIYILMKSELDIVSSAWQSA